ncbi:Uncharacterised protein [Bordetella pertussis]|nr:Uncharacterised protein [Bordetella pertussis]CFP66615.1 Uncharacterised protein [Bordetella pertussis]
MSAGPPAEKGAIIRMERLGNASAADAAGDARLASSRIDALRARRGRRHRPRAKFRGCRMAIVMISEKDGGQRNRAPCMAVPRQWSKLWTQAS